MFVVSVPGQAKQRNGEVRGGKTLCMGRFERFFFFFLFSPSFLIAR